MFIKSLELKNFKRFKELRLEFPGDITVIRGPNEQGKSTVVQALIAALFYDPAKSNEEIKSCKAWGCDKFYTTKLIFESGGEDYIVEKDFENKKIALKNQASDEIVDDYKEIMKRFGQLGGYQTPELFFNTACVKQGELAVLDKKQTISETLLDIVSGGGASVSLNSIFKRIEKNLEELKRGLEKGLAKNPGKILRLKKELQEKSRELEEKKVIFAEEDKSRHVLGKLRSEKNKTQESFELKEQVYKDNIAYFEIHRVLDGLNSDYEKIRKTIETVEKNVLEREDFKRQISELKKFSNFDMTPLVDMRRNIDNLTAKIKGLEAEISAMKQRGAKVREIVNAKYLIFTGIFVALGFLGFFFEKIFFLSWVFLGVLSFWMAFSKSIFVQVSRKRLEQDLNKALNEEIEKKTELKNILSGLGAQSIEGIEEKRNSLRTFANKIEVIDGKIQGILGSGTFEELVQNKKGFEKRIGIEEQKLERFSRAKLPAREEQTALERDLEKLRKESQEMDRKIVGLEAMLEHAKAPNEEIVRLEEKVYALNEELKKSEGRVKMLDIFAESLREAQQKTFSSTRKILEQYIGEFLSEITEGKYNSISVGAGMKIKVFSPEKNEEIEPEGNLSTGAIEQLYLVARFALISLLYSSASRPLVVLDDPFGNFDAKRKAKTRHILKKLSEKFQILLLTCSDEYNKWGEVIDLATVK